MKLIMPAMILSFLLSLPIFAVSKISIGAGGITPHYANKNINYCKRIDKNNTIANNSFFLRYSGYNHAVTAIGGEDSICAPILGLAYTYLFFGNENFMELNLTLGGYSNNKEKWDNHRRDTPKGYDLAEAVYINIDGFRFTPIIAAEFNFVIARGKSWAFKLNNLYAVYISNHSLALEFTF